MARQKRQKWTPETPWVNSNKKTQAVWPTYTCRNPSCKSYGKSHPNCQCRPPSFRAQYRVLEYDARGGRVGSHFCQDRIAHHPACEHYLADGGQIEANQEFETNPTLALDHAIYQHGLLHALTKTGHSRSEDPGRIAEDHLEAMRRGRSASQRDGVGVFRDPVRPKAQAGCVRALKDHLGHLEMHPEELLDIGGELHRELPAHATALGAKTAAVMNYLGALKPKSQQGRPLDQVSPPSAGAEAAYQRQLEIAEDPARAYARIQDGTLKPADLMTLRALYPQMTDRMQQHVGEALIHAKSENQTIPYSQKMKTSLFLGEPLDTTMTQPAMLACIQANADAETTTQGAPQGKPKERPPSAQTQKTIDKTNELYQTPLESLEMRKR